MKPILRLYLIVFSLVNINNTPTIKPVATKQVNNIILEVQRRAFNSFLLKKSLEGPVTAAEALAAVEAVAPAIEIIDSRYKKFKFSKLNGKVLSSITENKDYEDISI